MTSDEAVEPCPEGLEKYEFEVDANPPDPDAPNIRDRKNSSVKAKYRGVDAGHLDYGIGPWPGTVSITRMETYDPFKCRGCATQMREALQAAFPDLRIVDGGNSNEPVGDVVLDKWRDQGVISDGPIA
jgi:hypothetical protein